MIQKEPIQSSPDTVLDHLLHFRCQRMFGSSCRPSQFLLSFETSGGERVTICWHPKLISSSVTVPRMRCLPFAIWNLKRWSISFVVVIGRGQSGLGAV
ncbi:hypothetical protein CsSME_00049476 [Camellia sinensis var. sinensis]